MIKINYNIPNLTNLPNKFFYDGEKLLLNINLGTLEYFNFEHDTKETFQAHRIEVHLPSEHLVTKNGATKRTILELQIHHKIVAINQVIKSKKYKQNIKNAVVSILFQTGFMEEDEKFFGAMGISKYNKNRFGELNIPREKNYISQIILPPASYGAGFNYVAFQGLINLLNSSHEMYFYEGSENTPPCDEDVAWMIFAEPRAISSTQFEFLKRILVKNTGEKGNSESFIGNNKALIVKFFLTTTKKIKIF